MRVQRVDVMGLHVCSEIVLSQAETRTLARAAKILTEIRGRFQDELGEDNDEDTDIAMAAYTCDELAHSRDLELP